MVDQNDSINAQVHARGDATHRPEQAGLAQAVAEDPRRVRAAGVVERRPARRLTTVRRALRSRQALALVVVGAVLAAAAVAAVCWLRWGVGGSSGAAATALDLSGDLRTHDPALVAGADGKPW